MTIARWLTPEKRWIHDVGIEPDVIVAPPTVGPPSQDPVLDRALEVLATAGARRAGRAGRSGSSCLHIDGASGTVLDERKEVMCSDRQYA